MQTLKIRAAKECMRTAEKIEIYFVTIVEKNFTVHATKTLIYFSIQEATVYLVGGIRSKILKAKCALI